MPKSGNQQKDFSDIVKTIQTKFPNILLGLTVLVVVFLLLSIIFQNGQGKKSVKKPWSLFGGKEMNEERSKKNGETDQSVYVVKQGDYLWKIAEDAFGSGYNAYDIARANKIADPNTITPGQRITIPKVEARQPTKGVVAQAATTTKVTITQSSYTVKKGDYLWKIAQDAYGDGLAWTKIAKVNKIVNPDLIYEGSKLTLPR